MYVDEFNLPPDLQEGERVFYLVKPYIFEGIWTGEYFRRAGMSLMHRGDAAAATWIFL